MVASSAPCAMERGYGASEDLELIEEHGRMSRAKPEEVCYHAKSRQRDEMGTLGSPRPERALLDDLLGRGLNPSTE